ncbi:MAG: hypothetical protein KID04_14475 [Clostridium sp.]|nr:hypothetical protein [Clostridium sp.]DAI95668.1 MAG TPA: hypothetical protein [Caudoviricetes sp.]
MEISRDQIAGIAKRALVCSGGNRWHAYEQAKREIQAKIEGDYHPGRYDEAMRHLADALGI